MTVHPIPVRIAASEVGQPLKEVVATRLNISDQEKLNQVLTKTTLAAAPVPAQATDSVFAKTSPGQQAPGFYVFWRDNPDLAPRRINKSERFRLTYWLSQASPQTPANEVRDAVSKHLDDYSFASWLSDRIRRVSTGDADYIVKDRLVPTQRIFAPAAPDRTVAQGELYLVTERQVDVAGDWWKYTYAENTGAAFGFLTPCGRLTCTHYRSDSRITYF